VGLGSNLHCLGTEIAAAVDYGTCGGEEKRGFRCNVGHLFKCEQCGNTEANGKHRQEERSFGLTRGGEQGRFSRDENKITSGDNVESKRYNQQLCAAKRKGQAAVKAGRRSITAPGKRRKSKYTQRNLLRDSSRYLRM